MSQENLSDSKMLKPEVDLAAVSIQSRLLPFWREIPRAWFIQFEAVVDPLKTSDDQKYRYVLQQLQTTDLQHITDILYNPPATDKYGSVKNRLLTVYDNLPCRYCVTIIDRCTKWPEAVPLLDITSEKVAKALYENWIARFGCPLRISTDQGRQFESQLFRSLMQKFGITRIRTTAYHPQSNGQIERWHRTLKAALMARGSNNQWTEELPTVLLGLRTALRNNNLSPAIMTYGTTLRLPSDFIEKTKTEINESDYVRRLMETMASVKSAPRSNNSHTEPFIHKDLATCTHVFVRNDTVRSPLTPPYDGPYEVIKRYDKYYKLKLPLRTSVISLDRLKPAFMYNEPIEDKDHHQDIRPTQPYTTRSGRLVKPVVRFT